ncbi:CLUMA_CG000912, isoform A [Clunio marinus]|uniref:CLUMA_CG000912, isoform A n=1 Tax=Clunio marinus TaxID=568069 RepID=A0A1J1HGC2_9DIPT|nr:CLUMA_CG000912, isoform A [Clunio marinus]
MPCFCVVLAKKVSKWLKRKFTKSRDPVKILPAAAMDKIFSFLPGNQLIQLTTVSKSWNKAIGKSEVCMDKMKIQISEYFVCYQRDFKTEDAVRLITSGRKYKHLSISCISNYSNQHRQLSREHKLLMGSFNWKSFSLSNHAFCNEMELMNFFELVSPRIELIELRSVKIRHAVQEYESNIQFPNLKVLHLINVCNYIYRVPFKNVTTLLDFGVATEPVRHHGIGNSIRLKQRVHHMISIMVKNANIENLQLYIDQEDFDFMFYGHRRMFSQIEFKLESLMVGRFELLHHEKSNVLQVQNFKDFLQSQSSSMRELEITEHLGNQVLEVIINEMNNLDDLTLHGLEEYANLDKLSLVPNHSIRSLNMVAERFSPCELSILKNIPNLKHFTTNSIDQRIFNTLAQDNLKLRTISTNFFTAHTPPKDSVLNNLIRLKICLKSSDIFFEKIQNKENFTDFDLIFLDAYKYLARRWDVSRKSFYEW